MARKSRTISAPPKTRSFPHAIGYLAASVICLVVGAEAGYQVGFKKAVQTASAPVSSVNTTQIDIDRSLGDAAFDRKDWPAAIEGYNTAILAGANDANVYTDLGTAYRFNNQPQLALQEYQAAQAKWPNHENSLFNQGGVYAFALNEPDQAIKSWQSYLIKFPNGTHVSDAEQLIAQVKAHETVAIKPH